MDSTRRYKLIRIGKGQVSADFSDRYGRCHVTMRRKFPSKEDIELLEDGGYIIDTRPALDNNPTIAFKCPILNIDKPNDYIDEGFLREAGLGKFLTFWRQAGAKIAIKDKNKIIWNTDNYIQ